MTAPRRPRSAWLLVGSTSSVWVKVHSAGQSLRRLRANCRWYLVLVLLREACSSSAGAWLGVARCGPKRGAVAVLLELLPGLEQVVGDDQAGGSEVFLFAHSFAVGGEVAEQVRPADLAVGRVEVVVAAVAVGADDPVVAFAEHGLRLGGVPAGRDPEDRGSTGERAPEHPAVAACLPAGLVDVDDRRPFDLLLKPGVGGGERITGALHDRVDRPG